MQKLNHNLSDTEILDIFITQMKLDGLIFEGKDIPLAIGKTKSVKVEKRSSRKKNIRSGWYFIILGDWPSVKYGWRHGNQPIFHYKLIDYLKSQRVGTFSQSICKRLSDAEIHAKEEADRLAEQKRLEDEKNQYLFFLALTRIEYERGIHITIKDQHPYLVKKDIVIDQTNESVKLLNEQPYTQTEIENILTLYFPEYLDSENIEKLLEYQSNFLKYRDKKLLIRGQDIKGNYCIFQLISSKKNNNGLDKFFLSGSIKHSTFCNIGTELSANTKDIYLCEGWATGISVAKFTKGTVPVLICWDSGNMPNVAKKIREKYFDSSLYFATDNDHLEPPEKNAGLKKGIEACMAVGGYLVPPPLTHTKKEHLSMSDWNDIDLHYKEDGQRCFIKTINTSKFTCALPNHNYSDQKDGSNNYSNINYAFISKFSAAISLLKFGFLNIDLTREKQKELIAEKVESLGLKPHDVSVDDLQVSLHIEINKILANINYELCYLKTDLMKQDALFKSAVNKLSDIQDFIQHQGSSIPHLLLNILEAYYSPELSNAVLNLYLTKSAIYKPSFLFGLEILKLLKTNTLSCVHDSSSEKATLELGLFLPIIYSLEEVQFCMSGCWEARLEKGYSEALDIYNRHYNDYKSCVEFNRSNLFKIKILFNHYFQMLAYQEDISNTYFERLINRVNMTEKSNLQKYHF